MLFYYFGLFFGTQFQRLYVPGDNDVGGEGLDLKTKKKVNRFHRSFSYTPIVTGIEFANFISVGASADGMSAFIALSSHASYHGVATYSDTESAVRCDGTISDYFPVNTGTSGMCSRSNTL